jgi:hypothetical protein
MRRITWLLVLAMIGTVGVPAFASAAPSRRTLVSLTPQTLSYHTPIIHLTPGQNIILNDLLPQSINSVAMRPSVPGWIVGIKPNLILADGTIPPVDLIHLHHAVWLNLSRADMTSPGVPERFFAVGEEKTELNLPYPFGYRYDPNDTWVLNHMLHVLDNNSYDVRVTYELKFIPASLAMTRIKEVVPLWMDIQNGSTYPVFDVPAGSGTDGEYTYPTDAANPYGGGVAKNKFTVPVRGALVATAGHLHPGGLSTELSLTRTSSRGVVKSARLFKSEAVYYEPAGPVSWDVSMTATPSTWKVGVRAGDVLDIATTYDSNGWSWYEVMGIMVTWFAPNRGGRSPFGKISVDVPGVVTHGHLAENDNHGGAASLDFADPSGLIDESTPLVSSIPTIDISNFEYEPGDLDLATHIPVVNYGTALRFRNLDAPSSYGYGIWHTITTCKLPCDKSTGVAYPVADAPLQLDSGQLGNFGAPTTGVRTWSTPSNLPTGDYAYFCRVHPFMRGAFRVLPL